FSSSSRRHTRLQGDWSSDVCSSDLRALWMTSYQTDAIVRADPASGRVVSVIREPGQGPSGIAVGEGAIWVANSRAGTVVRIARRSEERRGGKERRSLGADWRELNIA